MTPAALNGFSLCVCAGQQHVYESLLTHCGSAESAGGNGEFCFWGCSHDRDGQDDGGVTQPCFAKHSLPAPALILFQTGNGCLKYEESNKEETVCLYIYILCFFTVATHERTVL